MDRPAFDRRSKKRRLGKNTSPSAMTIGSSAGHQPRDETSQRSLISSEGANSLRRQRAMCEKITKETTVGKQLDSATRFSSKGKQQSDVQAMNKHVNHDHECAGHAQTRNKKLRVNEDVSRSTTKDISNTIKNTASQDYQSLEATRTSSSVSACPMASSESAVGKPKRANGAGPTQTEIDNFLLHNNIDIKEPGIVVTTESMRKPIISFDDLPPDILDLDLQKSALSKFRAPTPIQAASWPFLFAGRDLIGVAETGSGKTLAFGLPCLQALLSKLPEPDGNYKKKLKKTTARALIISPTRELASQIHVQLKDLVSPYNITVACLFGGVPKDMQRLELKKASIIVATPGRLSDLVQEGSADLSEIQYLVLDEADRMLDKGFEDAIRSIIAHTPPPRSLASATSIPFSSDPADARRQTCMFTATWPSAVRDLASTFMDSPVHITIGAENANGELRANQSIEQVVEVMAAESKANRLCDLIEKQYGLDPASKKKTRPSRSISSGRDDKDRILVFCLYKKEASRVENMIRYRLGNSVQVAGIHGDMTQPKRTASLEAFKAGKVSVLVATDVAARGLDIPRVMLVINVTFPLTVEDYVHRIGRTGRAGARGLAVTFFTEQDKALAGGLVNVLKAAKQSVPQALLNFGTTVKKKQHAAYGAFYRETEEGEKAQGTVIRFD